LASPLTGRDWCRTWTQQVDDWLGRLFQQAAGSVAAHGLALVAVGGYGRAELCPFSDVDVVLLHAGRAEDELRGIAERLWYPVWDQGLKLGHAVRSVRDALALAASDLDTATSLLDVRHLAGDRSLSDSLAEGAAAQWRKRAKRWLAELARSVDERHASHGEVAFLLEPDLKEGRGGLRDVHALRWAEGARSILFDADATALADAYETLLGVRVELHRRTGRRGDVLLLQEQDAVAAALGDDDADALMARVSSAARTIAWTSDDTWARVRSSLAGPLGRLARRDRPLAPGLVLREAEVHVEVEADVAGDPVLPLRAAATAARLGTTIDRPSLEAMAASSPPLPDPWPGEARERLVELLLAGPPAVRAIEALDQRGLWVKVLPEWAAVRSRPQRNAYHRFTVDRHLVECAVGAAALASRVPRADLLVIGALLHDLGKGYPGDHTDAGVAVMQALATRMGLAAADVDVLVSLVRHHLLLPDVATRRDLDDPSTIAAVADAVGRRDVLELLAALTEADSLATGPAAWGPWKAELVRDLVTRVAHVLGGGEVDDVVSDEFPTASQLDLLARREQLVSGDGDVLVVVAPDRPGLFSRVAGVLALHGLAVVAAMAHSDDSGMAVEQFRVEPSFGPVIPWDRVRADVELALAGRLAVHARLEERARRYASRVPVAAQRAVTKVTVDNAASDVATVVEVQAPDGVGVLYRITRALAELDLDIRSARVQTLGPQVVDAFYVCGNDGEKLTDADHLAEVERAVLHALDG
jgi:[protein-PII] uridylyltransferase